MMMSGNQGSNRGKFDKLASALIEGIFDLSDYEVAAEVSQQGLDPAREVETMRMLIGNVVGKAPVLPIEAQLTDEFARAAVAETAEPRSILGMFSESGSAELDTPKKDSD
jgi:hypothetical protein